MKPPEKETLFTYSYVCICLSNFLMFFSFYLLLPVLPLYLSDPNIFGAESSVVGVILASYTIAALMVRPFSGYIIDNFDRKPLYLLCYFIFIAYFMGYLVASTLTFFTVVRATHGLSFGMVTTSSNTLAIDMMPSSRRGEGIGYFGITTNLAMALGPMAGLMIMENFSYDAVFIAALLSGGFGFLFGFPIRNPHKSGNTKTPVSLDRFFLIKGIPASISLFHLSFLYGLITSYLALFAREIGIEKGAGIFFSLMAGGLILSRLKSGQLIDKGYLTTLIIVGKIILIVAVITFIFFPGIYVFYITAIVIGLAFGLNTPSYQALFVNLAEHNQRGTANSTYLTAWDMGIGLGVLFGGQIAEFSNYKTAYIIGLGSVIISLYLFYQFTAPHFQRNKLR